MDKSLTDITRSIGRWLHRVAWMLAQDVWYFVYPPDPRDASVGRKEKPGD